MSTPAKVSDSGRDVVAAHLSASLAGDPDAFTRLYDALAPSVFGLALRMLRDPHQADEVTQEVFLIVWGSAGGFDPTLGSARTWVLTIAHRRSVDRVRTNESTRRRDDDYAQRGFVTPFDETAVAAHASLDAGRVRAALDCLTPSQRQCIELAYYGGHTYAEVSHLLQVPLGTAKTRIRDGLIRLRGALATGLPA